MIRLLELNLGEQYGGVEKHIEDILKFIDKKIFNIFVICRKNTKFEKNIKKIALEYDCINVFSVDINKSNIIKLLKQIRNYVTSNNIDVIHAHGITSSIIGNIVKFKKCKLITSIHGYSNLDRLDKSIVIKKIFDLLEKIGCKYSDACIAVSQDIKNYLINKGIDPDNIYVVHHGIILENTSNRNKDIKDKVVLTSLGRLEKVKGYDTLIRAISYCVRKGYNNIICKIAGNGSEKEYLQKLIYEQNIEHICELVGFIDDKEKFFNICDIYIQPSIIESFGISIIEAMQYNIPVIATNSGGIKEIIDDKITGLLFEKNDYENLGEKIIYLINNKDKRDYIGRNALELIKEKFILDNKILDIQNIIIDIANRYD